MSDDRSTRGAETLAKIHSEWGSPRFSRNSMRSRRTLKTWCATLHSAKCILDPVWI